MKREPMIPLRESKEAVLFASVFSSVVGFCVGAVAASEVGRFYLSLVFG